MHNTHDHNNNTHTWSLFHNVVTIRDVVVTTWMLHDQILNFDQGCGWSVCLNPTIIQQFWPIFKLVWLTSSENVYEIRSTNFDQIFNEGNCWLFFYFEIKSRDLLKIVDQFKFVWPWFTSEIWFTATFSRMFISLILDQNNSQTHFDSISIKFWIKIQDSSSSSPRTSQEHQENIQPKNFKNEI